MNILWPYLVPWRNTNDSFITDHFGSNVKSIHWNYLKFKMTRGTIYPECQWKKKESNPSKLYHERPVLNCRQLETQRCGIYPTFICWRSPQLFDRSNKFLANFQNFLNPDRPKVLKSWEIRTGVKIPIWIHLLMVRPLWERSPTPNANRNT